MSFELKVGQVWRDRSERKVAIVKNTTGRNEDSHPFKGFGLPWTYRPDGGFAYFSGITHEKDLIELVQDENGWMPWVATEDSLCPVSPQTIVQVRGKSGSEAECKAGNIYWCARSNDKLFDTIVAYKIVKEAQKAADSVHAEAHSAQHREAQEPPAIRLLQVAADHMRDRAATYDTPDGERSMGKTITAFNAVTGRDLSEAEGWLLLQILKDVRLFQRPGYHADSAEDCVAYAALKAEAKMAEGSNE